LDSNVVL